MEAITLNESLVNHVVPKGQSFDHYYIGAFHFRIWHFGHWVDVVVDDRLPFHKNKNNLAYIHSKRGDVFWAALLQKAYAKVYRNFSIDQLHIEDLETGYPMGAFQDLSGGIIESVQIRNPPTTLNWFLYDVFHIMV